MSSKSIFLLLSLVLLTFACMKKEEPPIPVEQLENILFDIHKADALATSEMGPYALDEFKRSALAYVLRNHGVSNDLYDSAMEWYGYHMDLLFPIYARLVERFTADEDSVKKAVAQQLKLLSAPVGDTVNIWNQPTQLIIRSYEPKRFSYFKFQADASYQPGDRFQFQFKPLLAGGIKGDTTHSISMGVVYSSGDPTIITQPIRFGEVNRLDLESDPKRSMSYLFGFYRLNHPDSLQSAIIIDSIELWRTHRPAEPAKTEQAVADSIR